MNFLFLRVLLLAGLQVLLAQFPPELESFLQDNADTAFFTSGHQAVFQVGGQGRNFIDHNVMETFVGQHDREHNVPLSRKSQFRIGSNSKTFTTIAIFQLQTKGLININNNVSDYLSVADIAALGLQAPQVVDDKYCPLLWDASTNDWKSPRECQSLTFRHLMAMRSGFINSFTCVYAESAWQRNFCNPEFDNYIWRGSIAETLATYINHPLQFAPGSRYEYSNGNQIFLSYFVQKYGGMKFELYLQENILEPLGMHDTMLDVLNGELAAQPNFVSAYHDYTDLSTNPNGNSPFAYGKITVTEGNQGTLGGSGGMISTVWDMAKLYASLFVTKNASAVISQADLAAMMTPGGVSGDYIAMGLNSCETWGLGLFMYYNPCLDVSGLPSCNCIDPNTGASKPKPEGWNETDRISVFYQVRTALLFIISIYLLYMYNTWYNILYIYTYMQYINIKCNIISYIYVYMYNFYYTRHIGGCGRIHFHSHGWRELDQSRSTPIHFRRREEQLCDRHHAGPVQHRDQRHEWGPVRAHQDLATTRRLELRRAGEFHRCLPRQASDQRLSCCSKPQS